MWKVYLDIKEYAAALANCCHPLQRDQVYLVQAEAAFTSKDYLRAGSFYAKINYILSFEEITLKFITVNEQDALRTFLLRQLDCLVKNDKCQITMISTWASELYLDKVCSCCKNWRLRWNIDTLGLGSNVVLEIVSLSLRYVLNYSGRG